MRYILFFIFMASSAVAQDRIVTLSASPSLEASGLWSYVLPRFKLKTRIDVQIVADENADVLIFPALGEPVFQTELGTVFGLVRNSDSESAIKFAEWLFSETGQRTVSAYSLMDRQAFYPAAIVVEEIREPLTGNINVGETIALAKCGRCHVVSDRNKYGGIDSTPSFGALRSLSDWREKFEIFWLLNPHPSFTQIAGITQPFDPDFPPIIHPIFLTESDVENIGAYMQTIEPKDLGPPLSER